MTKRRLLLPRINGRITALAWKHAVLDRLLLGKDVDGIEAIEDNAALEGLRSTVAHDGWGRLFGVAAECAGGIVADFAKLLPEHKRRIVYQELLIQTTEVARAGSMSSIVGIKAQPMHTDGAFLPEPPRYLVFYCLDPGAAGRSTRIWVLDRTQPFMALPPYLCDVSWISRSNRSRSFYCPVVDVVGAVNRVRYDPLCMKPLYKMLDRLDVENAIRAAAFEADVIWERGDLLVIDNWRCLHARSAAKCVSATDPRIMGRWAIGGH